MKPTPSRITLVYFIAFVAAISGFAEFDKGNWLLGWLGVLAASALILIAEGMVLALWAEGIHHGLYQKGRCLHGTKTLREAHSMWERERR